MVLLDGDRHILFNSILEKKAIYFCESFDCNRGVKKYERVLAEFDYFAVGIRRLPQQRKHLAWHFGAGGQHMSQCSLLAQRKVSF